MLTVIHSMYAGRVRFCSISAMRARFSASTTVFDGGWLPFVDEWTLRPHFAPVDAMIRSISHFSGTPWTTPL